MNCGRISTGAYVGTGLCDTQAGMVLKSPGKTILFSPESSYDVKYSPSFTVKAGSAVLVDAYNMPEDSYIYVNRLVKTTTALPVGNNCDPCAMHGAYGTDGVVLFRERMRLGCKDELGWRLQKHTGKDTISQMLIVVPGTYELELNDVSMLGDLEVELVEWNLTLTPQLPQNYFAGVLEQE